MAIVKHIKSRNSNYTDALEYLIFQHDEKTRELILDEYGRKILRNEFYIDGLNCDPYSFDSECMATNSRFKKNRKKSELKSHHYIISFDPKDHEECNLTGEKAQQLCLKLAEKNFPGHQALIVTHTDGDNHSGNIHTHIVINSVRKLDAERAEYMTRETEHKAGTKHRSTNRFLEHLKKEVMEMCREEGLHQIDLFAPAQVKITEAEHRAKNRGQEKLEQTNKKIIQAGLTPAKTIFQTQKDFLREAITACAGKAKSFEDFQAQLLEDYDISVNVQRGRYRYLHPDRDRRVTEKALGTDYGKEHLEQIFADNAKTADRHPATEKRSGPKTNETKAACRRQDYLKDPVKILFYQSQLRLVVSLQSNVKAMQNQAYARKVKISNLKQMANTIVYVQEHGYDSRADLNNEISASAQKKTEAESQMEILSSEMKSVNAQIHYTGKYHASKNTYAQFLNSKNKRKFRKEHASEIASYEEARDWLKDFYPDGKMSSLNHLRSQKAALQKQINQQKQVLKDCREKIKELETAGANIDSILNMEYLTQAQSQPDQTPTRQNHKKERNENSL